MPLSVDLRGHTALITGASSGLGRHFALVLARAGARIVAAARRRAPLETLVAEIHALGGDGIAVDLDVTDARSIDAAFTEATTRLGLPDLIVNNAGVSITQPALSLSEADWDTVVDTNLRGAWLVAQEGARRLVEAKRAGSIVNIASIVGLRPIGHLAPYAAAKAGLIHLTRTLAAEWARHRLRVNAIAPGYIETDINRDFWATDAGRRLVERIPMRRLGRLEDLDGPLLLLASDAGAFMTGAVLVVDGGHVASPL